MKKFVLKVKKTIMVIFLAIIAFPYKIFANVNDIISSKPVSVYGVEKPEPGIALIILKIITQVIIIPLALLIGLKIYFKKSKSSRKKKVLITIGIVAIAVIVFFVIEKF